MTYIGWMRGLEVQVLSSRWFERWHKGGCLVSEEMDDAQKMQALCGKRVRLELDGQNTRAPRPLFMLRKSLPLSISTTVNGS